jgi:hypothetical protein
MRRISLLALGVAIALPFLPVTPHATAEIQRGTNATHYFGPTWGFSLFWNPESWERVEEHNESGYDAISFHSGNSQMLVEGYAGFQGDAAACVNDQIAAYRARDDVSNMEVVSWTDDWSYETFGEQVSYTLYTLDFASSNGAVRYGLYGECRTLVPGESVLRITYLAEGEQFDEFANVADRVIGSLIYARRSLVLAPNPIEGTSSSATLSRGGAATVDRFIARVDTGRWTNRHPAITMQRHV